MQKTNIQALHETLVEIMDYTVSVCEEHGLRYCLLYGTALGARRHEGFIPWDDDLDMAMPREDYEKFIRIMKERPSEKYLLQNHETEKKYYLTFAKIRKADTLFVEGIAKGMYEDNGIFIDVFPLDYVKDIDSVGFRIKYGAIKYLKHIILYAGYKNAYKDKYSKGKHAAEHILCLPAFLLPKKWLLKCLIGLHKGHCKEEEACYLAEYSDDSFEPLWTYLPMKKGNFCGRNYAVPGRLDDYLASFYGEDYMELPPEDKRVTHLPEDIKF